MSNRDIVLSVLLPLGIIAVVLLIMLIVIPSLRCLIGWHAWRPVLRYEAHFTRSHYHNANWAVRRFGLLPYQAWWWHRGWRCRHCGKFESYHLGD